MRVSVEVDHEKCSMCGLCIEYCPAFVFTIKENKVLETDSSKCVECYGCIPLCPRGAISIRVVDETSRSLLSFSKKSKSV